MKDELDFREKGAPWRETNIRTGVVTQMWYSLSECCMGGQGKRRVGTSKWDRRADCQKGKQKADQPLSYKILCFRDVGNIS